MSLGTAAAVGVALGAIGGQTAANIYSTRSAGKQNRRAQDLQAEEGRRAQEDAAAERALLAEQVARQAALEERKQTEAQERWNRAMAADQARWQDYLRANEPHWRAGAGVLTNLYDLAGMPGGAPAMPDVRGMAGASFEERSAAAPGPPAPLVPLDAMAGGAPVLRTMPVRPTPPSPRGVPRRPYPTMARPASGGMSLQQLASLAALANRGSGGAITPTDPMYTY